MFHQHTSSGEGHSEKCLDRTCMQILCQVTCGQMTSALCWKAGAHHKVVNPIADCCGWITEWIWKRGSLGHKQGPYRKLEPKIPRGAESKIQLVFTRASSGEDGLRCNWIQVAAPGVP